ncbi:MAG: glycyl-radical enzyme activating protein [Lentisphaeria bacterium]|nr:glycyl-radical enzyme activating protein [Lentisphaeria bacterium]
MTTEGWITEIQRFSLNDGPGIRTSVFFKGCSLNCAWCHNPETIRPQAELMVYPARCIGCGHCVEVCPTGAHFKQNGTPGFDRSKCVNCGKCAEVCFPGAMVMSAKKVTVPQVMAEIVQDRAYYRDSGGGVTLSGGEVFCQIGFAHALISACREEKLHIAAETNLHWDFDTVRPLLTKLDLVMFDLKLADPEAHRRWTGVDNARILSNLQRLDSLGIPLIGRTPLIPGATDTEENIRAIATEMRKLKNLVRWELLNFNPLGGSKFEALGLPDPFASVQPLNRERMSELIRAAESGGVKVIAG